MSSVKNNGIVYVQKLQNLYFLLEYYDPYTTYYSLIQEEKYSFFFPSSWK